MSQRRRAPPPVHMSFRAFWILAIGEDVTFVPVAVVVGAGGVGVTPAEGAGLGVGFETPPVLAGGTGEVAGAGAGWSTPSASTAVDITETHRGSPGPFDDNIVMLTVKLPRTGVEAVAACIRRPPEDPRCRDIWLNGIPVLPAE